MTEHTQWIRIRIRIRIRIHSDQIRDADIVLTAHPSEVNRLSLNTPVGPEERVELEDSLMITVIGIANGMRNSIFTGERGHLLLTW